MSRRKENHGCLYYVFVWPFVLVVSLAWGFLYMVLYGMWALIKWPFKRLFPKKEMTGHDYEYFVADYLRMHGYHGVKVTQASGDFGVDVIAHKHGKKYAVQCKYYTGSVGPAAVQEAVAGKAHYGCNAAMVVTNSEFTRAAETLAEENDVKLIPCVKQK